MRPKKLPRRSSREWNRKILSLSEVDQVYRENQRGSDRRSAADLLARGPRRVGKSLMRNIARPLPISLDPPGNEPDVTQNGKGRQCVSAGGNLLRRTWSCRCNLHGRWIWRETCTVKAAASLPHSKEGNATTRLRSQQAVVDSRRLQPPFPTSGMYAPPQWGGPRIFTRRSRCMGLDRKSVV